MEELTKKLGNRIQKIRKCKNLTQAKLAELTDLDIPNISNIERGKRFVSAVTLEKIINALDVSPRELFDFKHIKTREELINVIKNQIETASDSELEYFYRIINLYKEYEK